MALRGSPMRRMVGNPLGGVLRDLDRRSRPTTRRRNGPREQETPDVLEGLRGSAGSPGPSAQAYAAAVVVTGEDGRARWIYPAPFSGSPTLTALPGGHVPAVPVEEVIAACAVLRVWTLSGSPAPSGVPVHATATPGPDT
jgi:hypothetical protein